MTGDGAWVAVVPVKSTSIAKSRLGLPAAARAAIALALLGDTLEVLGASARVTRVVVVTADPAASALAAAAAADVVPVADDGPDPLNEAVRRGARAAGSWGAYPVVVVPADLPSLTAPALDALLDRLAAAWRDHPAAADAADGGGAAYVPDLAGDGTTLLAAAAPGRLRPAYGPGSAAAHTHDGARRLDDADPILRRDLDTPGDLAEIRAARVVAGPRLTCALADLAGPEAV